MSPLASKLEELDAAQQDSSEGNDAVGLIPRRNLDVGDSLTTSDLPRLRADFQALLLGQT